MSSYGERRSFLLGMTLNELAFMMFFLLMLLSANALHQKNQQLKQETLKSKQLELKLTQLHQDLDTSFKRLQLLENLFNRIGGWGANASLEELQQAFKKLQEIKDNHTVVEENSRLQDEVKKLSELRDILQHIDPNVDPLKTLHDLIEQQRNTQQQHQTLRGQLQYLQRQLKGTGLDHPPCWADPDTGAIQYLYLITIHSHNLDIEQAWPSVRQTELATIPGAIQLVGKRLTLEDFKTQAEPIYHWSVAHECRHFVRIKDDPSTSKRTFKAALLTIESMFYKYLLH